MWRNLCEIFCGHFPWKLKDENLRKISPKLRRIFRQSFQIDRPKFHPKFALGRYRHKLSTYHVEEEDGARPRWCPHFW